VPLRVAQHGEDVGCGGGDGALDFDAVGHALDGVRGRRAVGRFRPSRGGYASTALS
jgi:hypothetical protein